MLRVFLKKHDFDPDMLIRVMLIKKPCTTKDHIRHEDSGINAGKEHRKIHSEKEQTQGPSRYGLTLRNTLRLKTERSSQ